MTNRSALLTSRRLRIKHALGAADRLIGQIEKAVDVAKVEFSAGERGQGRGGGQERVDSADSPASATTERHSAGRGGARAAAGAVVRSASRNGARCLSP